jgi:hypothetical protein
MSRIPSRASARRSLCGMRSTSSTTRSPTRCTRNGTSDLGCYGLHVMRMPGKRLGARRSSGVDEWCRFDLDSERGRRPATNQRRSPAMFSTALDIGDAVENMSYVDAAYRVAGMAPR